MEQQHNRGEDFKNYIHTFANLSDVEMMHKVRNGNSCNKGFNNQQYEKIRNTTMSKLKPGIYQDKKAGKEGHSKSVTYSVIINPVLSFRVSISIYQIKNKSIRTTKKCQILLSVFHI